MTGLWVVLGATVVFALVLVGLGKLFDRIRDVDPADARSELEARRGPDPWP